MTAKIKLNAASGGGSFSLQAPSSSSNNRVFTLPDIADATLSTENGLSEADQWRVTSNFAASTSGAYITSNWERNDSAGFSKLGTGLSESSGVFSFAKTGIYQIDAILMSKNDSNTNRYTECQIYFTQNNSLYNEQTSASGGIGAQYGHNTFRATAIVDVTDISQCKFKIRQYTYNSNTTIVGSSSANASYIVVKRLGDT